MGELFDPLLTDCTVPVESPSIPDDVVLVGTSRIRGVVWRSKTNLEDYYEKEIHHGRLYPNLDTVVEKGLVEKGKQDRRTNYYTITARGDQELQARRDWEDEYLLREASEPILSER